MKRIGYGQVEPNHLSAQRTGQIYAQLPATGIDQLENGQFAKYDYANGKVDFSANAEIEWMLVFNEVKLYDGYRQTYKDYVALASDNADKVIYPRLFKTNIGDIFTTNCLKLAASSATGETEMGDYEVGAKLGINNKGFLDSTVTSGLQFQVVKVYTLADGQEAVKVQRIA
jgi:hypothetical protein